MSSHACSTSTPCAASVHAQPWRASRTTIPGHAHAAAVGSQCGHGWCRPSSWASASAQWLTGSAFAGVVNGLRRVIPLSRGDGRFRVISRLREIVWPVWACTVVPMCSYVRFMMSPDGSEQKTACGELLLPPIKFSTTQLSIYTYKILGGKGPRCGCRRARFSHEATFWATILTP